MKYHSLLSLIAVIVIASCTKSQDPYLISKHSIGLLTDSTQVKDLQLVYPNDSITRYIGGDEFTGAINTIEVYEKGGKKLLVLTPKQSLDSTATIKTVQVMSERFKTAKGLNTKSTFKDIKDNYKISSIQNTIRNIVISVNDINAFFTIDKNELPAELRFDMNLKIEAVQIPEEAKINFFFMHWD
jgi:hypothetical protein